MRGIKNQAVLTVSALGVSTFGPSAVDSKSISVVGSYYAAAMFESLLSTLHAAVDANLLGRTSNTCPQQHQTLFFNNKVYTSVSSVLDRVVERCHGMGQTELITLNGRRAVPTERPEGRTPSDEDEF